MVIHLETVQPGLSPRSVYIGDSKSGDIWKSLEWKKIMSGYLTKGTILKIHDSSTTKSKTISISAIGFSRELAVVAPVLEVAQKAQVSYCFLMALADQRGNIYVLDFVKNKFWLVARTGVSASCLTFNAIRRRELLVGLSDHTVHCYDIDTCQMIAKLPAFHQSPPLLISVHPTKPLAISSAYTEAVLWDTQTWERKRLLEGGDHHGLQQASFSPDGMMFCASFVDGSIYFWTLEFSLIWKIDLAQLAIADSELSLAMAKNLTMERLSYFDLSFNGEFFAFVGLSSCVYIWNLFEKRLLHEILIPSFEGQLIVQAQFLGMSNILALLSSAGEIIFINASNATFVSQLKGKNEFHCFSVSPDGRCLAAITKDSKYKASLLRLDSIFEKELEEKDWAENEQVETDMPAPPIPKAVVQPPKTFFELIESKQESTFFNRAKIRGFLQHYGSYPDQFRPLIWRFLLKLPENRASYEALLDQGTHPSFREFRSKYPLKSDRAAKSMERILSCLAFWSPIFEDLDYLPSLVFPFVKLFWNDLFSCLEVVMTVLMNWCQKWWEYYPNPPVELLDMLTQLVSFHDPELFAHFTKNKITAQVYGWALMQSLFSELFSKKDWLTVWDHLVSNPPSFFYHFIVSYLVHFRKPLLKITELKDFYFFFQRRNATNVTNIILGAYKIKSKTPSSLDPSSFLKPFEPSTRGEYPIFNQYPQFIVNYQSKMKDKIRQEEVEYIKKRQLAAELARLTQELKKEKQHWESSDWKMNDMIEKWWNQMVEKENLQSQFKEKMNTFKEKKFGSDFAQVHQSFTDHAEAMAGTNAKQLAKAVPFEKKKLTVADRKFEKEFEKLENEWDRRRKEMLDTREELVKIREAKGQTNVNQVDPSPTKSNEKFDRSISPFKSGIFPSAEITSIKLDQTLPTNPSSIHSEYERISQISPIKVSPTKSEESLGKSVHFNLTHSQ